MFYIIKFSSFCAECLLHFKYRNGNIGLVISDWKCSLEEEWGNGTMWQWTWTAVFTNVDRSCLRRWGCLPAPCKFQVHSNPLAASIPETPYKFMHLCILMSITRTSTITSMMVCVALATARSRIQFPAIQFNDTISIEMKPLLVSWSCWRPGPHQWGLISMFNL